MTKYRMTLQYVGTRYHGWQTQKERPTIQLRLQETIHQITGEEVSVVGSGRTDSGVHALGQVAHFRLSGTHDRIKLFRALNGLLPWDIRVRSLRVAAPDFHAQRDAVRKKYEYRMFNGPVLSPFLHNQVFHNRRKLNLDWMQEAAQHVLGNHDFSGFAASGSTVKSHMRTVFVSRWLKDGHYLTYQIIGDGFLHHMVRNIVGTLLEIGTGRRAEDDVPRILASRDRRQAGPTAPAQGLYLVRVWYLGQAPA